MLTVRVIAFVTSFLFFSNCSTTSNSVSVLQRADNLSSKPEWASLANAITSENNKSYFLGYVELNAEASKSAALNMSDQKAYSSPMESMVEEFFQQNKVAEDLKKDSSISELIMSAARASRPPMPGLRVTKRYWEIIETKSAAGISQQLHVYSLAEIPTPEYEKAKKDVLAKLNGNSELKKQLDDVAARQKEKLLPKS